MAKIEITKTELVWPGKYNEDGTHKEVERVNLPFQVIETINETRATREAAKKPKQPSLFDIWQAKEGDTFEEGWKNKLVWGDNLVVMGSLLEKFAGKIDLIYIDPPFATGADFKFTAQIGDGAFEILKEHSIIEEKAYRDTWGAGRDSFLKMIYERLVLMRDLLAETGAIYVHLDWNFVHYVKTIMDGIFGTGSFLNEVIHCYGEREKIQNLYNRKHQTILFYVKNPNSDYPFNAEDIREEFSETTIGKYRYKDEKGWYRIRGVNRKEAGRLRAKTDLRPEDECEYTYRDYLEDRSGPAPRDWFLKPFLNQADSERVGYPTQKNPDVIERFVLASSLPGQLVADLFCGSGTTLAVAEKLGRRWIGCDLSRWAIHVTRKRLLGIENCKPFEILNLGKYERKYWQGVTFGDKKKTDQQLAIYQYLAFILKLYGAEPISGMEHLHGKKGNAVVHVGAVDAPVTIDEINACIDECVAIKQKELHILGWEWEMGLYDLMTDAAKGRGIKLVLLNIPREVMEQQAVDKGDIQFFELAYLEVDIKQEKGRKVVVALKDFVIPNTELIPEEIRSKIKKWSDYIDYWAVDWNFQNDTFMNGWVTYRTRKDRTLALKSDPHTYEKAGKYTIMVKVVDIFGNDTSQAFELEVK
jgi:adenine-specific DNA-methyltransferase